MGSNVSLADVLLATRHLMTAPKTEQPLRCSQLFECAEEAASLLTLTGRVHGLYGDGSLSALSLRRPLAPMPARLNGEVLDTLELVLSHVRTRLT